jgi:hypothetical protein
MAQNASTHELQRPIMNTCVIWILSLGCLVGFNVGSCKGVEQVCPKPKNLHLWFCHLHEVMAS